MTKVEMLNAIKAVEEVAQNAEMVDFIEKEISIIQKRNANKAPSKRQKENEELKPIVLDALAVMGEPCTVSDLIKSDMLADKELSTQRATPILKKLEKEGKVVSAKNGKSTLYSVAEERRNLIL